MPQGTSDLRSGELQMDSPRDGSPGTLGSRAPLHSGLGILYRERLQSFALSRGDFEALWTTWPRTGGEGHWYRAAEKSEASARYSLTLQYYGLHLDPERGNDVPTAFSLQPASKDAAGRDPGPSPRDWWTLSCLACHSGSVDGTYVPGLANNTLMLDDLAADIAAVKASDRSGLEDGMSAAQLGRTIGVTEATLFGELLLRFRRPNMDLKEMPGLVRAGAQNGARIAAHPEGLLPLDAPAWWQLKHKTHLYLDHSVEKNHRTTMQFTLGLTDLELEDSVREVVLTGDRSAIEEVLGSDAAEHLVALRESLREVDGRLVEGRLFRRIARTLPSMPVLVQLALAPHLRPGGIRGETIRGLDDEFREIFAFIESLEPPPYPKAIDEALAEDGRALFNRSCARCHGHYDGSGEGYVPKRVSAGVIGTDHLYPTALDESFRDQLRGFLTELPDGTQAEIVPDAVADEGYVAPPLYGVWATAPYLHNGSVPTLDDLLDYTARSERQDQGAHVWVFEAASYDHVKVGLVARFLEGAELLHRRLDRRVHDGLRRGMSPEGHDFGEALDPRERRAVIEYLKTL